MAEGGGSTEPLELVVKNQQGEEVQFRVKPHTRLQKVFTAYCVKKAMSEKDVRFIYESQRLTGEHTPAQLGMESGDSIDCVVEAFGGHRSH